MTQFNNVSIVKKANVFFDGKCVSHSVLFPDGTRKTVGVIMPGSRLTFNVDSAELMEITSGTCTVNVAGSSGAQTYTAGMQFSVAANGSFDIHAQDTVNYVCSFD
ncbi:MAG: pyrimidine/purine nucleoside phosphorylase [Candidatus Nitrotoga sp.]|jgi:purine/pyrimidine-nucleoside phosphorylase|nr:pyrimidine/purine nucleoside phosphorylase [Candidatus Nitrotoga sp.]MBA0902887.1 pyrimidine/purine nucleoside phosphorylase [Candidatus Nitrotoga sp.]MBP0119128.1 pyrimidine/purine nucleoside phosphorylase [Candidatus Nitrotoga sp.]MDW7534567.1 pyrimidine/purine nucleoside phosphorylase [Candidatus Nitrotoga sp.]MDW7604600.1 pyrimidine/purine nucleoside phosphorylase [Candidatus Nitrotoga sp.]